MIGDIIFFGGLAVVALVIWSVVTAPSFPKGGGPRD